jgi:hypothetical protein
MVQVGQGDSEKLANESKWYAEFNISYSVMVSLELDLPTSQSNAASS